MLATTVKFSTNGLPKLRSGLLLKKKEGPPSAAYSLQSQVCICKAIITGWLNWENGSRLGNPLIKIKEIHLPGKMLHLLVSFFMLGVKKQNHLVS